MTIRRANVGDINGINKLLFQVLDVHCKGRNDLFVPNTKKYSDRELKAILEDYNSPVFIATDEGGEIAGYAFCVVKRPVNSKILCDKKTLYIDDFCVEESRRGQKIGTSLFEHVVKFAEGLGCYNLTLNVWAFNSAAVEFYEKMGLSPQKFTLEKIL